MSATELRHLKSGTLCPGAYCEECLLANYLDGNLYWTVKRPLPLPRRVRLRLWATRQIDRAACRLVERQHERAAVLLWRMFGLWR